jgi:hypothetical protein
MSDLRRELAWAAADGSRRVSEEDDGDAQRRLGPYRSAVDPPGPREERVATRHRTAFTVAVLCTAGALGLFGWQFARSARFWWDLAHAAPGHDCKCTTHPEYPTAPVGQIPW